MDYLSNAAKNSVQQFSTQAEATGNAFGQDVLSQVQQQVVGGAKEESQHLLGDAQHVLGGAMEQVNGSHQEFGGMASGLLNQVGGMVHGGAFDAGIGADTTNVLGSVLHGEFASPVPGSIYSPRNNDIGMSFLSAGKDKSAQSINNLFADAESLGLTPAPAKLRGDIGAQATHAVAGAAGLVGNHLDFAGLGAGAALGFANFPVHQLGAGMLASTANGTFEHRGLFKDPLAKTEPTGLLSGDARAGPAKDMAKTAPLAAVGSGPEKKREFASAASVGQVGPLKEGKSKEEEAAQSAKDKATEKLDNLRVKTMHEMVNAVDIPMGDSTTKCQFLYLTNKQAAEVKIDLMPLVRQKLELREPDMVIRLIPSRFGQQWWQGNPYYKGRFPAKQTPEDSGKEEDKAEHQLLLLAKEVLLPFANRTKALILGQEGCSLTAAFLKVAASYQKQMKQECPFNVLIFASAYNFNARVREATTTVSHFYNNSEAWKRQEDTMTTAIKGKYGDDESYWPRFDLPQGRYSLIMFECLNVQNGAKISEQTPGNFQNDFISSLSKVPAIAVQTYGSANMNLLPTMAEHVSRGSSLLLIDSRKRHQTFNRAFERPEDYLEVCETELKDFSVKLHQPRKKDPNAKDNDQDERPGLADWYNTSALAFVKLALDKARDAIHKDITGHEANSGSNGESTGKKKQSEMWLWEAISSIRKKKQKFQARAALGNAGGGDGDQAQKDEARKASLEEKCLVKATNIIMNYVGAEREWEATQRHERFQAARQILENASSFEELKKDLKEQWLAVRGVALHKFRKAEYLVAEHSQWFTLETSKPCMQGSKVLVVKDIKDAADEDLGKAKKALLDMLNNEYVDSHEWDQHNCTQRAFCAMEDKWMAIYDILKSDNVETGSLHQLKECSKKLGETAKIDYLPERNTFEALILIRRAWTLHDVFRVHAGWYKYISKISIMVMLLVGTATVTVVSLNGIISEDALGSNWKTTEKHALLGLSLFGSLITGLTTLMEPTRKWLHLRGAQLRLESEIWKFRTRMADYVGGSAAVSTFGRDSAERQAEANFKAMLAHVQEKVGGAGLKRTRFYSIATTAADTLNTSFDRHSGARDATARAPAARKRRLLSWFKRQMEKTPDKPHLEHTKYIRHGQFEVGEYTESPKATKDNHHSPQSPESYIRHRLVTLRDYYQGKIPTYANLYRLYQALLLLASVVSALIAAIWEGRAITAVIASLAGLIAAWQEFTAVEKKLDRYSGIANSLENILLWWQALPPEEKKNLKNVERLVTNTEALVAGEQAAWMSDTQQTLQKVQQQNQKNGEVAVNMDGGGNNGSAQGGRGGSGGNGGGKAGKA